MEAKVEAFFGVYLLVSLNPKYGGCTYIGFTVNPNRRVSQHNRGQKFGGARKTEKKGPWEMVLVIHGFPNKISALRFEWAWQHPRNSRRLKHLTQKRCRETSYEYSCRILYEMLRCGPWCRLPLTIRWIRNSGMTDFASNKSPPSHMPIVQGYVLAVPVKVIMSEAESLKSSKTRNKDEETGRHEEYQYLDLVDRVLRFGDRRNDRTGTGTLSIFGPQMRFSLKDGIFPLLTTKKVFWRGVAEELFWFIKGSTDSRILSAKNVRIWDANSNRQFLDSQGLNHRAEGDLGPIYGFQWRHFGAKYIDMETNYDGQGIDQLANVIKLINSSNPNDRRIIICSWNAADLDKMALPPCHCLAQFYVSSSGELSCLLHQRSADLGLGVPFNIASYALLTHMIAHVTNKKPGELVHNMGDAHIYTNHIEALKIQLQRIPRSFAKIKIKRKVENIEDFCFEDFELIGYDPHPKISMEMAL